MKQEHLSRELKTKDLRDKEEGHSNGTVDAGGSRVKNWGGQGVLELQHFFASRKGRRIAQTE